ncbi:MAG TPA: HAD family hydrolase [Thermoplasmata archaeon]|nr:HAD family hydrolase [Thermoplasmata archaeon]
MDRDGTLNPDLKYLREAERLEVYRGVIGGIRLLKAHGYRIVCVTNQSGIERGFYTEQDVRSIHDRLNTILRRGGVSVDRFYYCPHAPETGCECRKPRTKLFQDAARELGIAWAPSAIIGDRGLDIEAGESLGLYTVLVPSRGHRDEVLQELGHGPAAPDVIAPSFYSAAVRILHRG